MFRLLQRPILASTRAFPVCRKFLLSFSGRMFFSRAAAAANRPTDWVQCNDTSSLNKRVPDRFCQSLGEDAGEESSLDHHQRAQLFSGRWPADFSGEVIRVRTSLQEYHQLFNAFAKSEPKRKYDVRLQFNKAFSLTAVRLRQTALHECLISSFTSELTRNLPPEVISKMDFYGNTAIGVAGLPDPDFQLGFGQPHSRVKPKPTFAMEVAFSEDSDEAEERAIRLLRETTVRIVVIIDIKESPAYNNPLPNIRKGPSEKKSCRTPFYERIPQPEDLEASINEKGSEKPFYYPVFIHGLCWVGEMAGIVQVFAKDFSTGKVVRRTPRMGFFGRQELIDDQWKKRLARRKKRQRKQDKNNERTNKEHESEEMNELNEDTEAPKYVDYPQLNVTLAEFSPCEREEELKLDWDCLRSRIGRAIVHLAVNRCSTALRNMGNGQT